MMKIKYTLNQGFFFEVIGVFGLDEAAAAKDENDDLQLSKDATDPLKRKNSKVHGSSQIIIPMLKKQIFK